MIARLVILVDDIACGVAYFRGKRTKTNANPYPHDSHRWSAFRSGEWDAEKLK